MASYHQMGHDSENLLRHDHLEGFSGAVLSPLNYDVNETLEQVALMRDRQFELVFDPQLYNPLTERKGLRRWSYFPSDMETADLSDDAWWASLSNKIAATCVELSVGAVCSPVVVPRVYDDAYYGTCVGAAVSLEAAVRSSGIQVLQTLIVNLSELAVPERAMRIASIISRTSAERVYLVLVSDVEPRRELKDGDELRGALTLIASLKTSGLRVLVGFCSSDMLLWKAAGADDVATGKFFNLRRFTRSRFDEPTQGGGQLAYWFEESLMAFIRESDVVRMRDAGLLGSASEKNPFCQEILAQFRDSPGTPWVKHSWRQFMYWFAECEAKLSARPAAAAELLQEAERAWLDLEESRILTEELRNDGSWLRHWRRALLEYA